MYLLMHVKSLAVANYTIKIPTFKCTNPIPRSRSDEIALPSRINVRKRGASTCNRRNPTRSATTRNFASRIVNTSSSVVTPLDCFCRT